MKKADIGFISHRMDSFINLIESPDRFFEEAGAKEITKSRDCNLISAALFIVADSYLRGRGLKYHPSSSTQPQFMEELVAILAGVQAEVKARSYLYPYLFPAIGRSIGSLESESLLEAFENRASQTENGQEESNGK